MSNNINENLQNAIDFTALMNHLSGFDKEVYNEQLKSIAELQEVAGISINQLTDMLKGGWRLVPPSNLSENLFDSLRYFNPGRGSCKSVLGYLRSRGIPIDTEQLKEIDYDITKNKRR